MNHNLEKLLSEVAFNFSRSGGRGGQNVNKVETKVELVFNIENSRFLNRSSKELLLNKLKNRVDKNGNLRLVSQSERTQQANRKKVIQKFVYFIKHSLKQPKKRIRTALSEPKKRRRLESKRKHSQKKKERTRPVISES